jgi:hypothetical protein
MPRAKKTKAQEEWEIMMDKFEKEKQEKRQKVLSELKIISAELYAKGVTKFSVEYSGEGDSGDFDCDFYEKNDAFGPKNKKDIPENVKQKLLDIVWEFVPSGFENNDGGFGAVHIDFKSDAIELSHNERVIEVQTTEQKFDFDGKEI